MENWLSYYHPSTVVFVDDQQAFLTIIKHRLPKQTLAMFFNNAEEALDMITQRPSQYRKSQHIEEIQEIYEPHEIEENFELDIIKSTEALLNIQLEQISKISHNLQRFSEISVVVVDRMMPELDGISFCRRLINHPIKKIMLTASKDLSIATKAFNEGIIDFFLLKDAPNLMGQLNSAIKTLQKEYFLTMNNLTLGFDLEKIVPIINNPLYMDFIQQMVKELGAAEHYLLDRNGSMLFIKSDGTSVRLIISPEEQIDNYANIAIEHEESHYAQILSTKDKLLYFPAEADKMRPVKEWKNFLFEARKLPASSDIFYSLIQY